MPPLGMHAYRLFSSENRHEVQTALKFEGKPAGMSDVAKVLGQKWRELSEESKKVYLDQAGAAAAEAAAAAPPAGAEAATDAAAAEDTGKEAGGLALPLARVKKVIRLDGDVKQVSADAARLIAHATVRHTRTSPALSCRSLKKSRRLTAPCAVCVACRVAHAEQELFISSLTAGSHAVAASGKRRTVRFADVEQHVMRRGKLWFLHEHMPSMRPKLVVKTKPAKAGTAPAAEEGGVDGAAGATGEPGAAVAKPTRAITSFFAAAPAKAAPQAGGEEDEEAEEEGGDDDMDEEEAIAEDAVDED